MIKEHAAAVASKAGLEIEYLGRKVRKESLIQEKLAKRGNNPGLVCIFSNVEPCYRFMPYHDKEIQHTGVKLNAVNA